MSAEVLCRRVSMNGVASNLPHVNAERREKHLSALVKRAVTTTPNAHILCGQGWSRDRVAVHLQSPFAGLCSSIVSAPRLPMTRESTALRGRRTTGRRVSVDHHLRPVPSVWRGVHRAFGRAETRKTAA